jgi:integrase
MIVARNASPSARQQPDSTITFLTQDEVRRLFSVIKNKRDRAIFAVAYRHGLRASEVGLLQRTDVDFKQGRITIHRLKGSFSGAYPMKPDTVKLLRSYLRERIDEFPYLFPSNRMLPIDRRTLYTLMRKYSEAADVPAHKRKFHSLKHSIATHILDAGEDVAFCRDWLGHKNIQNTMIYALSAPVPETLGHARCLPAIR